MTETGSSLIISRREAWKQIFGKARAGVFLIGITASYATAISGQAAFLAGGFLLGGLTLAFFYAQMPVSRRNIADGGPVRGLFSHTDKREWEAVGQFRHAVILRETTGKVSFPDYILIDKRDIYRIEGYSGLTAEGLSGKRAVLVSPHKTDFAETAIEALAAFGNVSSGHERMKLMRDLEKAGGLDALFRRGQKQ